MNIPIHRFVASRPDYCVGCGQPEHAPLHDPAKPIYARLAHDGRVIGYFPYRQKEFLTEIKALLPAERAELAALAAEQLGVEVSEP